MHMDMNVYECERKRHHSKVTRLEQEAERTSEILDELIAMNTQALIQAAESNDRERRLIGMVEDRDRVIDELKSRIGHLSMPNGRWEGSE